VKTGRLAVAVLLLCFCGGAPSRVQGLRVVSLVPSITEIVYALGREQVLVGNTTQCDFPEAARAVYKVGDFMNPDVERIVALRPGIVFCALPIHERLVARLKELNIRTYASRPASIAKVLAEVDTVGRLLGAAEQAGDLVARLRARLDSVIPAADSPRVYLEISSTPLMTPGSGSFINELVSRAGGRNVFAGALQEYPTIDAEAVLQADPEVMLILHPDVSAADVGARVGWSGISAVRTRRVYDNLDEDLFFRPGPRIVEGVALLARLLSGRTEE
jgi:iron complex transport system substrate-binding protein